MSHRQLDYTPPGGAWVKRWGEESKRACRLGGAQLTLVSRPEVLPSSQTFARNFLKAINKLGLEGKKTNNTELENVAKLPTEVVQVQV